MADEEISVRVRLRRAREFAAGIRKMREQIRQLGNEGKRSETKFAGFNRTMTALRNVMGLVKPLALIAALGMLAQVAGAAAAGIGALVGAMGPLLSLSAALPAVLIGLVSSMKVLSMATSGIGDALGGLNEQLDPDKMDELTPAARALAYQLHDLKPAVMGLQEAAQAGLFPGMSRALRTLAPMMSALLPVVEGIGRALADVMQHGARVVTSWRGHLAPLAAMNERLIRNLGMAAVNLADALVSITLAAIPMIDWMTRGIHLWSMNVAAWASAGEASGRLTRHLQLAMDVFREWAGVLGPFSRALGNIFRAAMPTSRELLRIMGASAESFRAWTASAGGQNAIAGFFQASLPAMVEVGRLIDDLVTGFFRLASTPGLAETIAMLRTELGPALGELMQVTTSEFLPVLIPAITNLLLLFAQLATANGPLAILIGTIGSMVGALAGLLEANEWISTVMVSLLVLLGAMQAFTFIGWITGLTKFVALLGPLATALKLGAAAQWILNAALYASPLLLPLLLMAAVVVAVNIMYAKVEWFRDGVHAVLDWIRGNWPLVLAILTGPVGLAALAIHAHWDTITGAASDALGWLRSNWPLILAILTGPVGLAVYAIVRHWDTIKDAFRAVMDWIAAQWNRIASALSFDDIVVRGRVVVPGFDLPQLATGGTVTGNGSWITGEAGPELNTKTGSTVRVTPLTSSQRVQAVGALAGAGAGGGPDIVVQIDGREVARAVDRQHGRERARA